MKFTTFLFALLAFSASAQTKFKDYPNLGVMTSNTLFIVSRDDAGGGTRHASWGQMTNQLGATLLGPQYSRSGNSNSFDLFFYGDSITAGIDATRNKMPFVVASNLFPFFKLGHPLVTHTKDGVDYTGVLAGSFPGEGNNVIADAMLDATNNYARGGTSVLWGGRNHSWIEAFPAFTATNLVVTNHIRMINSLGHSNWLVLSVLHSDTEAPSSVNFRNITNLNRAMSKIFTNHFYDWWPDIGGDSVSGIPASNYVAGTHVHLNDLALSKIGTGVVARISQVMNSTPVSAPAVLTALQRSSGTNAAPAAQTNFFRGYLSYSSPTYLSSMSAINGSAANFSGPLSGVPLFGLAGFLDGAKANSGSLNYSIHHVPGGNGWTNLTLDFLVSTDCDVSGPGGHFIGYAQALTSSTNTLNLVQASQSLITTVSGLKSNVWTAVRMSVNYTEDIAPRQVRIYWANLGGAALTNNVYIMEARAWGYNSP